MSDTFHIGIIASSNGGVFRETSRILDELSSGRYRYSVVTDRPCGIETFCHEEKIPHRRIAASNNQTFSIQAQNFFEEQGGVNWIQLYFLRLITREIFSVYPSFNIHPSLLPAHRGFNALKNTLKNRDPFFGATLHLVNEAVDEGPIVAQIRMPLSSDLTLERLKTFSFLQKVYLSLLLTELFETDTIKLNKNFSAFSLPSDLPLTDQCNPALENPNKISAFQALQTQVGEQVIV